MRTPVATGGLAGRGARPGGMGLLLVVGGLSAGVSAFVAYVLPAMRRLEASLPDHAAAPAGG